MVEKLENITETSGSVRGLKAQEYGVAYTEGFNPDYSIQEENFDSMRCRCSCAPTPGPYCNQ